MRRKRQQNNGSVPPSPARSYDTSSIDTGRKSTHSVFSAKSWGAGTTRTEQLKPPTPIVKNRRRRRSVSLPRISNLANRTSKVNEPVTATLSAVDDIERLAQIKKANEDPDYKFKVFPDFAYPNTRMNRDELRVEMNLPSAFYHNLRQPSRTDEEVGLLYLEVLQCFGLPRFDYFKETSAFCIATCGSMAFKTDVMPPLVNPMWLSKMRRACVFPIYHAYQCLSVGVFSKFPSNQPDGFAGRVGLKISQFRPFSTYDVTLPLRQSAQVYTRQQRGAVRIRFHLHYHSERAAVWSYIPKSVPKLQPNDSVVVNCTDAKSFQNVARTVHGVDMQSKFSVSLVKAVSREVQFQQIHILRYLQKREYHNLTTWKYPIMSAFVFGAWMHAVYFGTIRYLPGHILTYLLMHMWKNYGTYCLDGKYDNGFMAPTFEELLCALFSRKSNTPSSSQSNKTKKGKNALQKPNSKNKPWKPCIEPITLDRTDPNLVKSAESYFKDDGQDRPQTLEDTAKDFRRRLPTDSRVHWLKVYQNTFVGADAVTFFVREGYAKTRVEAVGLGKNIAASYKLFQHMTRKDQELEDSKTLYYRFLTLDNSAYKIITHKPLAKGLFRALNFRSDPALAREHAHIEFPFATAADHSRFKVKDGLILRNKESKALFEKMQAEKEEEEAANAFGVDRRFNRKHRRRKLRADERSEEDDSLSHDSNSSEDDDVDSLVGRPRNKRFSPGSPKPDRSRDRAATGLGISMHSTDGHHSSKKTFALDPTVMIERRGSSESFDELIEEKTNPNIEIKILPKPSNQNLSARTKGGDKNMATVLATTRFKMHQYAGHFFHDRPFRLDMPKTGLGRNSQPVLASEGNPFRSELDGNKKTGFFKSKPKTHTPTHAPVAHSNTVEEEEQIYLSARKDEFDRLLQLGKYAHTNMIVSKVAEFVQPMIEMAQIGIFVNRALFNVFTWRDPILSFWVVVIGTLLVIFSHCFPWRIVIGCLGVYLVGPQNFVIRIAKEKAGYEEPNFDMLIKKKKKKKEAKVLPDEPLFSNLAPDNRIIRNSLLDGSNIRPVAVPVSPLMYNRFYDWPPEPEYSRAKSERFPQNDRETAQYLQSIDFDPEDEESVKVGGIAGVVVKPVTRWMRARQKAKKAVKGMKKMPGVVVKEASKVAKEASKVPSKVAKEASKVPGAMKKMPGVVAKEAGAAAEKVLKRSPRLQHRNKQNGPNLNL